MKFERYSEYKDSGIDWLVDIPSDWEVKRLKDVGFLYSGLSGKSGADFNVDDKELTKPYISFTNIANNHLIKPSVNNRVIITKYEKQNKVKYGDLFFLMSSESYEDIGKNSLLLSKLNETYLNSFCKGFRISDSNYISRIFLNYLLSSSNFRSLMVVEGKGFTRINLKIEKINSFSFIVPLLQEQTKIANYLDTQTAKIDKKIALLGQKIQKYQELKQALINETVLKGLDKTTPLKDSYIEWIGSIPRHWEVKRLKDVVKLFTGNSISNKHLFTNIDDSYPYVATKDVDINTGRINYNNGIYIPKNNINFKTLKCDTTLLCIEGGSAGKKIAYTKKEICFVNKLCAIKANNNNYSDNFIFYLVHSLIFKMQFFSIINGLIGGVPISSIKIFICVQPPIKEQTKIANYLDEKTSQIDSIINAIQTQITTLTEFRKTLINDTVTGKIKVA